MFATGISWCFIALCSFAALTAHFNTKFEESRDEGDREHYAFMRDLSAHTGALFVWAIVIFSILWLAM